MPLAEPLPTLDLAHEEYAADGTRDVWYTYNLTCARPEVMAMAWPLRSFSRLRAGWERKEERRFRHLMRTPANPGYYPRVHWLLPYGQHDRDQPPIRRAYVDPQMVDVGPAWAVKPMPAQRCWVVLDAAPPAIENEILSSLSNLYLISDQPQYVENVVAMGEDRVVADDADLRRWKEATDAYLGELAAVNRDLWQYWVDHGQRLGVFWGRPALLRSWQDHVRSGYARLVRASDAYRPVFDEITAAIATVQAAEQDLAAQHWRLFDWQERRLWYLKPNGEDGLTIVRSDVSGEPPPDGITWSLAGAYHAARVEHDQRLIPVDWDEASLRACDAELAQLSAGHSPVARTRSGRPVVNPSPVTFAAWFEQEYRVPHDKISDRDDLARRQREREKAKVRKHGRRDSADGGSWPTDLDSRDYDGDHGGDDHGGGDHGGGDYGSGGYTGGGDHGSGGYSGGGDYGGSYGGFSGGGSY